ncbi:hypothetical protein [Fructobacillus cardui]|uniref:hypothetical protein n=1 Tax=Fructobacillus cardui TaxID=2893170 RepID=UPI002D8D66BB|nr:hypothetical protein R53653_IHELHDKM_01583 [Fructobacillus cardui]
MEAVELGNWLIQNFSVTNALLSIIIVLIIVYLVKSSDLLRDKFQKRNAQSLQVEEYFRKVSGDELNNLLNSWLDRLDTQKTKNFTGDEAIDIVKRTTAVSSNRTTTILAAMLQHIYLNEKNETEQNAIVLVIYIASIIDSLKYDFTNQRSGIFVIIQSKINDFAYQQNKYRKAYKVYKKELSQVKRGIGMSGTVSLALIAIILLFLLIIILYFINRF